MKPISKVLLTAVLAFGLTVISYAQKGKVGYINSQELMLAMPEMAEAEKSLQLEAQNLEAQIMAMQNELQTKYGEYQAQAGTMSDIIRQTKEAELNDLQTRIQNFQMQAQESLQIKESELVQPVMDKAKIAIKEVAKVNGYDIINDLSAGIFIVYPEEDDILSLVKKHMGIIDAPKQ